ncbi:Rrf2 family transcriptional regulator, partial [Streptococcus suis]
FKRFALAILSTRIGFSAVDRWPRTPIWPIGTILSDLRRVRNWKGTMRLSSLADYAVVLMTAAARLSDAGRLNATRLAEETGVPLPTAQKLVSRLSAAGLLASARGTGGG